MAKSLQRKKPGYTKAGMVKIISLSTKQLAEMLEKTQQKKIQAKIRRRLNDLGYVAPTVEEVVVVVEE